MSRLLILLALAVTACATRPPPVIGIDDGQAAEWRRFATDADRERLRGWRDTWTEALPLARKADARTVAGESALLDADRAMGGALPPPGAYRCRAYKLGKAGTGTRDFAIGLWQECRVTDRDKADALEVTSGPQRPAGLLFTETDARAIFLGTMVYGDEGAPIGYGIDRYRNIAGYIERIEERRWRLVLPRPAFEAVLEVVEIVPA